jgi:flagellar hook protein FlgE
MIGSLWTGISGLAGAQTALDNESNNIANVNTIGFKSSRISFADQMYQNNIGKGTQVLDAEKMYIQGNLKTTGVSYDVALAGDGFFAVSNTRGSGTAETFYTRAGNFRMGDSGTLQDTIGNEVQGWAVGNEPVTTTSNPNVSIFTGDYTKLLSSKIINYSTSIETVTAKATNYTLTAVSDEPTIMSGYGLKTKYGKISDVESLVKAYSTALQNLKSDPNSSSASAIAQSSHIDLPDYGTTGAISKDGDQVYVYIDGNKIFQSFIAGTDASDGYIKTMKAFADKISEASGLKAYVAEPTEPYTPSTKDADILSGVIRIESLIPGQAFTISSVAMASGNSDKPGIYADDVSAEAGKGVGALESIRDALNQAITGKQTDIYTPTDLNLSGAGTDDFTYQISIYSETANGYVTVPVSPLKLTGMSSVDEIVAAINDENYDTMTSVADGANTLPTYVKAYNINGNLVIRTLDSNFDVEFSGDLKDVTADTALTAPVASSANAVLTYSGATQPAPDGEKDYTLTFGGKSVTVTNPVDMASLVAAINDDISFGSTGTITASIVGGDLVLTATNGTTDITSALLTEGTAGDIKRNADYSGREGAGAEFLEIKTKIDQTASKSGLQLRLDTLGISDSAFGDFQVDATGLITMTQDGAMFAVGQIAIAKFITNRGLEPVGNNLLRVTLASGDPIYNINNDKTAEVKGNTLELSTADLSESLVNLMVFQRAFEANSKSITTADTILNTLIQLKR